ncbi:MAG TPA: ketol-acid reductoisomerase [Candidatus Nanoarchaeia archaeon]|nr:ketol-acid reductoisomerase [Candidatus Nanoarchaeia archaeon]
MKINFGGGDEGVVTRQEFTLDDAIDALKGQKIGFEGYGSQGPAQSQNLRDSLKDHNIPVFVGQRKRFSKPGDKRLTGWENALKDGWEPGKNLFSIEEAADRATIIAYLTSDAGQRDSWPSIERYVEPGKMLYFSHGFGMHFNQLTGIKPREGVDVGMIAPKGAGLSVRENYLNGLGINASFAVARNFSGRALEKTLAMGRGIGAAYMLETTFRDEVVSDHFGERAFLLGEVWALAEAAYDTLRQKNKIDPREAFINSSEQITQVILPLIGQSGAAEIYRQAQEAGHLGTVLQYKKMIRNSTQPLLNRLYKSVEDGIEAKIALDSNSQPDYDLKLAAEYTPINKSEMWTTGREIRAQLRDRTYGMKITNFALAGAILGAIEAQYQTLIDHGHRVSEAINETVEEATESLNRFYQREGVSHLLGACSTTAQRGALDWGPRFKAIILPQFLDSRERYPGDFIVAPNYTSTVPNVWNAAKINRGLRPGNQRAA